MNSKRNINIEILRILAMLLIVFGHALEHGGALKNSYGITKYILMLLDIIHKPSTNIYILISSYFLVTSNFKIKHLLLFWCQVFFYSVIISICFSLLGLIHYSIFDWIKIILPISSGQYWFARVYLGFYIFSPFWAIYLRTLTKRQYQAFLVTMVGSFCLWQSFIPFAKTWNPEAGNGLWWFLTLFSIGGYIKLYRPKLCTFYKSIIFNLWGWVITIILYFVFWSLSKKVGYEGKGIWLITAFTSIPILYISITTFIVFISTKEITNNVINKVILFFSSSTFSVYLIHEHPVIRSWLWNLINIGKYSYSYFYILIIITVTIAIYMVCTFIDKISWQLIKKVLNMMNLLKWQSVIDYYLK